MIKVWLTKTLRHEEEKGVTPAPPLEISLERAIEKFHLAQDHWIASVDNPPRLVQERILPAKFLDYSYVILEVPKGTQTWKAGFYRIPENMLTPTEAIELMKQEGWQSDK